MSFRSIYRHGFVRVAACTITTSIADPLANALAIEAMLRGLAARSVGLAVFPELAISGYAIDDLLLQDALLASVERAVDRLVAASRDLLPLISRRRTVALAIASLQLRARHSPRPASRRRAKSAFAELPRILRTSAFRFGFGHGRPGDHGRPAHRSFRSGFALCSRGSAGLRRPRRSVRGSVGAGATELAGGARRRQRSRQSLGQQYHDRQGRHAPALVPVAIGALSCGLSVLCRRQRRIDDRSFLRRTNFDFRERRSSRRVGAFSASRAIGHRRRRSRSLAPGTFAAGHVRRQRPSQRRHSREVSAHCVQTVASPAGHRLGADDRAVSLRAGQSRAPRARLL